ncbi:MAG: tyrosine-type recombinase/integrase [Alphaproteobacteria bacterium]|nr:tyrosine-type recombinase/integrase [Alphaproteobacteria bacterium]
MRKRHPKNVRIKRQYLIYLEDAKRLSPTSVDQIAAAIDLFDTANGFKDFAAFNIEQARKFKRHLDAAKNPKTGKPLSKATTYSRLMALKDFFKWLAGQPGYKSKFTYSDADYFNPSNNDGRIANASREKLGPTLEQVRHVLASMPTATDIEKRDRALFAFAFLSGARDDAIASMLIKHVDLQRRTVFHDARSVRTKDRKTITSTFFPVGDDIEKIVAEWIAYLTETKLFGTDDPLFPATQNGFDENKHFSPIGLARKGWTNPGAIRRVFRKAFEMAGLPYFNPHLCRKTLAALGQRLCATPEELKAWSQNLAHENVLTTFTSYGNIASHRQAEIMNGLAKPAPPTANPFAGLDKSAIRALLVALDKEDQNA